MAKDYAGGPAEEVVLQAARELLLAESSDWQFLISTFSARDYAEVRFNDHIDRFGRLAEIADRVHIGSTLTVDEKAFLRECQLKDAPFQYLDLAIWSGTQ
jgi:1,4-alpha-glucan branching enzyme